MIKSIIAPLLFSTLVVGIAGHGDDLKRVGRLALKSIVYFEAVTTVALFIGLVAVNLVRPGVGVVLGASAEAGQSMAAQQATVSGMLNHLVPQSIFEAFAQNEVLQIVFWSVLFGVALTRVQGRGKDAILAFCEGLAEVIFKLTGIIMTFAPIGVGAAIAVTVGPGLVGSLLAGLTYAKAGHAPPIVVGATHDTTAQTPACPIGAGVGESWPEYHVDLAEGVSVCLVTDGLEDAKRAGERQDKSNRQRAFHRNSLH